MEDLVISTIIGMDGISLLSREAAVARMPSMIEQQATTAVEEASIIIFIVDGQCPLRLDFLIILTEGGITHQDFAGHEGTIHTSDVQWMTAGRGIIHFEMPAGEGVHKGLQLWINLFSQEKIGIEPGYQELSSEDIPSAEQDGAEVRVIAGESMGVQSPVYTRTPTLYLDFSLRPRAQVHQHIPESWNAFAYIIEGEGVFGHVV